MCCNLLYMQFGPFTPKAGRLAVLALCEEARTAPKPGLVDPFHTGAHMDMDYTLLLRSARCLEQYFQACFRVGSDFSGDDPAEIFTSLRLLGREAEKKMFAVTAGVNTHKGAIFSLGLLAAAAGLIYYSKFPEKFRKTNSDPAETICLLAGKICAGIVERDLLCRTAASVSHDCAALTAGEMLFQKMGVTGIRGEAENGFPVLRTRILPILRGPWNTEVHQAEDTIFGKIPVCARLDALLSSMTCLEDSCLLARGGSGGLDAVRTGAYDVLMSGGAGTPAGRQKLIELDRFCCENKLSPGGSADMLSSGLFLVYFSSMTSVAL